MKYIVCLLFFILSSCVTVNVDQREIIPELFDPELKKGKIFIFSNHADIGTIHIRVNDEEREIKHTQTQIFELKDGQNSVYSFNRFLGSEQENCDNLPYTFDTKMFPKEESHFFIIQSEYGGVLSLRCYKDFHVQEAVFMQQINNPRSRSKEFYEGMTDDLFDDFMNEVIF